VAPTRDHAPALIALALALACTLPGRAAHALDPPAQATVKRSGTWPYQLDLHVLIGGEPQPERGTAVAFGVGAEVLWRLRVGAFVALLSSEGSPLMAATVGGKTQPSLGDRVSVPFGLAARPFGALGERPRHFGDRLLGGLGVQLGATIEHVRTSDDSQTTGGLHLGLSVDVPVWGGPGEGGVALRLYGRLMVTPEVTLEANKSVFEPHASGQIFGGLAYYP
jgi:hypothetical protein